MKPLISENSLHGNRKNNLSSLSYLLTSMTFRSPTTSVSYISSASTFFKILDKNTDFYVTFGEMLNHNKQQT